jgi:hypothetical protein
MIIMMIFKMCIQNGDFVYVIKNKFVVKVDMTLQIYVHVFVICIGSFISFHLDINIFNGTLTFKMFRT